MEIDERGRWLGRHRYHCDYGLMQSLCDFAAKQSSLVDFGCGSAEYSKAISNLGLHVEAYDGNPYARVKTGGFVSVLDLSEPFDLKKKFDVVLSLEVAEHIPKQYEKTYINNLTKHANDWIVLSWAIPGQGGVGHVNEQTNEYVLGVLGNVGFVYHEKQSKHLRNSSGKKGELSPCWWFKNTIMVFRKRQIIS